MFPLLLSPHPEINLKKKGEWGGMDKEEGGQNCNNTACHFSFLMFLQDVLLDFIYLSLEKGEGKEKERERKINVWLPFMCPLLGTWPATQGCALTGNRTGNPLVRSPCSTH